MSADLRAAARNEPLVEDERPGTPAAEPADTGAEPARAPHRAGDRDNPFADLEPPSWVEN
jgi:hypothetical protein